MLKQSLLLMFFSVVLTLSVGCGGNVQTGVADGEDDPEPVLTEEQIEGEKEATRNSN